MYFTAVTGTPVEVSWCHHCGQQIVRFEKREKGWNHYPFEKTDWDLTEKSGCYCKAEPEREKVGR